MVRPLLLVACVAVFAAGCATPKERRVGYETYKYQANCLTTTGSHIKRRNNECLPVPGRAYGRNAIHGTGAGSTAGALAGLDPAVRIGR